MILGSAIFLSSMLLSRQLSKLKRKHNQIVKENEQSREKDEFFPNQDWILISGTQLFSKPKWKEICSQQKGNEKCEVKVINNLRQSNAVLCWIGFDGTLHHYRRVNDRSINDGSVPNYVVEFATVYHAFVCYIPRVGSENAQRCEQLNPKDILFFIQPTEHKRYVVSFDESTVALETVPIEAPVPLRDSLTKEYEMHEISGFTIYLERSIVEETPDVLNVLQVDLEAITRLLPPLPLRLLQTYTPIFVNASLIYGTVTSPINGRHMCYHPHKGAPWLEAHGLSPVKSGCVEVNRFDDYLGSRELWGVGGLLLHELCHAFHDKHTPGGYDCSMIHEAYEFAMKSKLYDCVAVHGRQGENGPIKAYACANCMEFWAELSVAYHCKDSNVEFNKWYPHNSMQLRSHDQHSHEILNHLWQSHEIPCNADRLAKDRSH